MLMKSLHFCVSAAWPTASARLISQGHCPPAAAQQACCYHQRHSRHTRALVRRSLVVKASSSSSTKGGKGKPGTPGPDSRDKARVLRDLSDGAVETQVTSVPPCRITPVGGYGNRGVAGAVSVPHHLFAVISIKPRVSPCRELPSICSLVTLCFHQSHLLCPFLKSPHRPWSIEDLPLPSCPLPALREAIRSIPCTSSPFPPMCIDGSLTAGRP